MAVRNEKTATKVEPFKLELPVTLNPEPKFTVPVAKNWTAFIYETPYRDRYDREQPDVPGYRVIVRHNKTGNLRVDNSYPHTDVVSVKLQLEQIAASLAPKEKVRTMMENEDTED